MRLLASDVGGTFVDLVLYDTAAQRVVVDKAPSTRHSAEGVIAGVRKIADRAAVPVETIARFVHGCTVATNVWLTRRGGKVLFLTTAGFRDVLEIGTQRRPKLYSLTQTKPAPLAPRSQVVEVEERIDAFGEVVTPLRDTELRRLVQAVIAAKADAVAISLLFSFLNPAHERRLAEAIAAAAPGTQVYLSSDINPEIEEYVRANTTVAAAYVGPAVDAYVGDLQDSLREIGLPAPLLMRSDGGVATPEAMRRNPATMLLSGPAGGVIAAAALGRAIGASDLVTFDMGGTSADFSLIAGGEPQTSNERVVNDQPLRVPMLDIETISAGGGSIATVDHAGGLRVGPQSAGSVPGPACYGAGGTAATVTDAAVILGLIDPDDFAGGDIRLVPELAETAMRTQVAEPLGLAVEEAALGVVAVACAQMRQAIRALTIERGYDIRRFALVAFGGAGPIFAALMQRDLGIGEVLIPPRPGVFAALGLLMSDLRHNAQASFASPLGAIDAAELGRKLGALAASLDAALAQDGIEPQRRSLRCFADLRYTGQFHDLTVELPSPGGAGWWRPEAIADLFHRTHDRVYGHNDPAGAVEMVAIRVVAEGAVDKAPFPEMAEAAAPPLACGTREVLFAPGSRRRACPVYRREDLGAGHTIAGPALVSQSDTTVLIAPGQTGRVDRHGVIRIRLEDGGA